MNKIDTIDIRQPTILLSAKKRLVCSGKTLFFFNEAIFEKTGLVILLQTRQRSNKNKLHQNAHDYREKPVKSLINLATVQ
jgi:hypothetical protein